MVDDTAKAPYEGSSEYTGDVLGASAVSRPLLMDCGCRRLRSRACESRGGPMVDDTANAPCEGASEYTGDVLGASAASSPLLMDCGCRRLRFRAL